MDLVEGLVSIVIPVYNVERYLRACIDSALAQTYRDTEIIVVDDGSTDSCPQICDEYAANNARVKVTHQENGGLSNARNTGLRIARGEYVYFLDSDDYIAENAIEDLYDRAREYDLDVVLFDGFVIDEAGTCDETNHFYIRKGRYDSVYDGKALFAEMISNSDYRSAVQFSFIRKACLVSCNLSFREGIVHEDELFTFLLLMHCERVGHLAKPLYYRRIRDGSIMQTSASETSVKGGVRILDEMAQYYAENECQAHVRRAIRKNIAGIFHITCDRYSWLSESERQSSALERRQLNRLMRRVAYLHDWLICLRCESERAYRVYRRIRSMKYAALKDPRKVYRIAKRLIPQAVRRAMRRRKYKARTKTLCKGPGDKGRIVLFLSPEHDNLGDHAIARAEVKFFRDYMPSMPVIQVSYQHYLHDSGGIRKYVRANDVLVTNGGGYLGTLWFHNEEMVRRIIQSFPNNKIVILPQTIFFEEGQWARQELAKTRCIYSNHEKLIFCARERNSYDFVNRNGLLAHPANCHLIPDMVAYLCESKTNMARHGILLCLRKDKESVLSGEQKSEIQAIAERTGQSVFHTDTIVDRQVSMDERSGALESKFDEFRAAKLVITDRLHGMLFATITGTPCIALNNRSGKVKGCYNILGHLEYVRLVDSADEIVDHMGPLLKLGHCVYDNHCLLPYYDKLAGLVSTRPGEELDG